MTKEEWIKRYAKRFVEISGYPLDRALEIAEQAIGLLEIGEDPEESAEIEYSYWTDDGE